jgi:hypothetical protein
MQPSASGGAAHCRWGTDATVNQLDDAIATVASVCRAIARTAQPGRCEATKATPKSVAGNGGRSRKAGAASPVGVTYRRWIGYV